MREENRYTWWKRKKQILKQSRKLTSLTNMMSSPSVEPRPYWWKASVVTPRKLFNITLAHPGKFQACAKFDKKGTRVCDVVGRNSGLTTACTHPVASFFFLQLNRKRTLQAYLCSYLLLQSSWHKSFNSFSAKRTTWSPSPLLFRNLRQQNPSGQVRACPVIICDSVGMCEASIQTLHF